MKMYVISLKNIVGYFIYYFYLIYIVTVNSSISISSFTTNKTSPRSAVKILTKAASVLSHLNFIIKAARIFKKWLLTNYLRFRYAAKYKILI
jgi:hypothetical protein